MAGSKFPAKRPIYYYITDRRQIPDGELVRFIRRAIRWGVDFVQIREKDLPDRDLYDLTCSIVRLANGSGCRILVNGRPDIALAAGADGVHLPAAGYPLPDLMKWLPPRFIVGVSAHSGREVVQAESQGADYTLLGPVYPTPSKLGYGKPLGLAAFRRACRLASLPVLGLGGIGRGEVSGVLAAGAAGIAGIRLFQHWLNEVERVPG